MTQLWFPGFSIGPVSWKAGALLDVWLLGLNLRIPPIDLEFPPKLTAWESFIIFDSDWVFKPIEAIVVAIPKAVWDLAKGTLDSWAEAFYKAHSTYEDYVREQDEQRKKAEQQAK